MEDIENDDDDNGRVEKSFSISTLILLRSLTVWKGLKCKVNKIGGWVTIF